MRKIFIKDIFNILLLSHIGGSLSPFVQEPNEYILSQEQEMFLHFSVNHFTWKNHLCKRNVPLHSCNLQRLHGPESVQVRANL